jgi:hypothetical protein
MMSYKYYTGTLTDKRRAELDAVRSFNQHAKGEHSACMRACVRACLGRSCCTPRLASA